MSKRIVIISFKVDGQYLEQEMKLQIQFYVILKDHIKSQNNYVKNNLIEKKATLGTQKKSLYI